MNLPLLIKKSYSMSNGDKLRTACYNYMQYTNNIKIANDLDLSLKALSTLNPHEFSGEIINEEFHVIIKAVNTKVNWGEILKKIDEIDYESRHNIVDAIPADIEQVKVIMPQILETKAPFLSILSKSFPWVIGALVVALVTYLYTKNKKEIDKFAFILFKKIKNIGSFLLKAIIKGYKWLVPIISNIVFVKSKEMWKEYSPTIKEYGAKGLDLAKEYGAKGLDLASKGLDYAIWLKDKHLIGESSANYLLKLRKDDKEQKKMLENIKLVLRSKKTARLNLIRTAFDLNPKLGRYVLKNI